MSIYESQICDICNKKFVEGDDIVVCPECGAPYHRSCWQDLGHCAHESEHASGFEWKKVPLRPPVTASDTIVCPECGALMPVGTKFCENCGAPLEGVEPSAPSVSMGDPSDRKRMSFDEYIEQQRAATEQVLSGDIDGVPIRDMAVFMGPNAGFYVSRFKLKESNPKYRPFCWAAAFFAPLYFLCRKMYKWAGISFLVSLMLSIPSSIILLVNQGIIPATYLFSGIETIATVLLWVELAVGILFGFLAVPIYKDQVVRNLKKYREQSNGDQTLYYDLITRNSGRSRIGLAISAFVIINYLFQLFR